MAVFKATSYTKHLGGAKASIRYIESQPGKEGKRLTRLLFGADGVMSREEAYRLIDEAKKGMLFYRLVISPDPRLEDRERDLSLWEMTKKTMQTLEERLNQEIAWVATEHKDHAPNRHVHIIAVLRRRLNVRDFAFLRGFVTQAALLQRQQLDLNQTRDYRRGWGVRSPAPRTQDAETIAANRPTTGRPTTGRFTAPVKPSQQQGASGISSYNSLSTCCCPYYLALQPSHLSDRVHRCRSCGKRLHQELKLKPVETERKESGWEL